MYCTVAKNVKTTSLNNYNKPSFKGIYDSKLLKKGLLFASNNGALFAAGATLALSTIARPIAILATPNTDKDNKKYACAKSFASSIVGYFMMLGASLPIAHAVKSIDKSPEKYLKPNTISSLKGSAKTLSSSGKYTFVTQLFKLGLAFVLAAPKSFLTCSLIPPIMKKMFKKDSPKESPRVDVWTKNISFKGIEHVNPIAKKIGKIIDSDFMQKLSNKFHKSNFEMHIMSLTDAFSTFCFVNLTKKNKKIEKDRKDALIYNSVTSTALSIAGGYTLDRLLKKPTEKFIKKYSEINKNDKNLSKYIEGIKIAKPILILGGIYYIIIPFISTFLADRIENIKKN